MAFEEMRRPSETEVWGTMSSGACAGGVVSFLVVGSGMPDVLGWQPSELIGREVAHLIVDRVHQFHEELCMLTSGLEGVSSPRRFFCKMQHKNGTTVDVVFLLYRSTDNDHHQDRDSLWGVVSAPLVYQIRTLSSFTSLTPFFAHALDSDVFEALATTRDSSWQYEIQQVRFANQRLEEEIAVLSKRLEEVEEQQRVLRERDGQQQQQQQQEEEEDMSTSAALDQYIATLFQPLPLADYASPSFAAAAAAAGCREWDEAAFAPCPPLPSRRLQGQGLKRAWDLI